MVKNNDSKIIINLLHLDRFKVYNPTPNQIFNWINVINHINSDVFDNERLARVLRNLNPRGGLVCFFIGGKHNSTFYIQHKALNQGFIIGYSAAASGESFQKEDMYLFIEFLKDKVFHYE